MRDVYRLLLLSIAASLAVPAAAQQGEWRITPYAWIAGFDGTAGLQNTTPGLGNRIDVENNGIEPKEAGAMLHLNYRKGRVSAFGDWTYVNVKADAPTPFAALFAGVDVKVRGNIVEANAGYDVLGAPGTNVDVFGGVRYYDVKLDLGLREGVLPGTLVSGSRNWTDGVVGVRWQTRFADRWEAFASADVGAGGSDLAWQLYGGVGYRFSWGSLVAGWRHLHVNYEKDSFKLDAALSGPLIGASFQF